MAKIKDFIKSPAAIAVLIFLLAVALTVGFSIDDYNNKGFRESLQIEAHGIIIDVLVIGVLFFWLGGRIGRQKLSSTSEIQRYRDEIDDFRGWESEEASLRIRGNIVRLNKLESENLELQQCYLKNANLHNANLYETHLIESNLEGALMRQADLRKSYIWRSNLRNVDLWRADLREADLWETDLEGADLRRADLRYADLRNTNLVNTDLRGANLRGVKHLTFKQISKAILDSKQKEFLEEKYSKSDDDPLEKTDQD